MKISARNVLKGKVTKVTHGAVNSEVVVQLPGGVEIISIITKKSAKSLTRDKESQYGMGLVAFEYEKFIGRVDRVINIHRQTEFFWKAYHSAQRHFGEYSSKSIPAACVYEENILSFLETLGYPRGDFVFFPKRK